MRTRFVRSSAAISIALGIGFATALEVLPASQGGDRAAVRAASQKMCQIQSLLLEPVDGRLKLVMELEGSALPQVVSTKREGAWVVDLAGAKLAVDSSSGSFRQPNPVPGVLSLEAEQVDPETVRVEVVGDAATPQGFLSRRSADRLEFNVIGISTSSEPIAPTAATPDSATDSGNASGFSQTTQDLVAQTQPNVNLGTLAQPAPAQAAPPVVEGNLGEAVAQAPIEFEAEDEATDESSDFTPAAPTTIPRLRTRAIAPPVGDIAISTINLTPPPVNLGSNENVTLSLRDAPVSDVLGLLVRRAGLNVILNDVSPQDVISLDVQDTPLQEVFNSILRLNQLSSERVGATVFVGTTLPGVQDTFIRTFRLNQAVAVDRTLEEGGIEVTAAGGGSSSSGDLGGEIEVTGILPILESFAVEGGPLVGMKFFADERTNSITALGTPQQLDIVAAQIAQLDVRKRQVLINVKLVDVELGNDSSLGIELGGTSGNFAISGVGAGNFGGTPVDSPAGSSIPSVGPSAPTEDGNLVFNTANRLKNAFALRIDALIESNDAKVLADPKIVVSDGGFSTVSVGQEVITNIEVQTDPATLLTTQTFVKGNAGVTLNLRNVRIDDNGFVSMDISPQVSSPGQTIILSDGTEITLLNQRTVNSQQVRVRDGETLVLSGLIQDTDRVTVSKVPILGDIPLLGALFRRQTTDNTRNEVVLMVTPNIIQEAEGLAGRAASGTPVSSNVTAP
ncbi:MAG: secretin N-terminal domain-containing protein [Cyanobacteria bacterium J06648_11]